MQNRFTILVTGIGGNVGQGVLRNLKALSDMFILIGVDIGEVTGGHHLCDFACQVPYAYDESYVPLVKDLCVRHGVDLIIPTTDSSPNGRCFSPRSRWRVFG